MHFSIDRDLGIVLITSEYSSHERYGGIDCKLKIAAACLLNLSHQKN